MNDINHTGRIFQDPTRARRLVLPWRRTLQMCWSNIQKRRGRYMLVFVGIAVVVAFFISTMTYQNLIGRLKQVDDIHVKAVLEKAGIFAHDAQSEQKAHDQMVWMMTLSGLMCFVGIVNTMLMSVTERFREIGTLKCLGALDSFVVRLFMIESIFIGVVGSLLGALGGYLLSVLQVGLSLEFKILQLSHCLGAFAVGVPTAVIAGTVLTVLAAVYPTVVAARMKPVDAMRSEI
jgi:ABC-type lipoprotein release transport system permease subunit